MHDARSEHHKALSRHLQASDPITVKPLGAVRAGILSHVIYVSLFPLACRLVRGMSVSNVGDRDEGASQGDPNKGLTDDDIETNWVECIETFDAMDLREDLLRGIYAYGFEKPSAIQQVSVEKIWRLYWQ